MNAITPLFSLAQHGRASEDIALQIEAAILSGQLQSEQKLPSEREMQHLFGTGRGVIREALRALKEKGLLEIRLGSKGGAYVRKVGVVNVGESLSLFLKQHDVSPLAIVEFRESIDHTLAVLAIARGTEQEKKSLVLTANSLRAHVYSKEIVLSTVSSLDRELNLGVARMAKNNIFEWVMQAIQRGFSSCDYTLYNDREYAQKIGDNWVTTAKSIQKNDPLQTHSLIGYHYTLLRERLNHSSADYNIQQVL